MDTKTNPGRMLVLLFCLFFNTKISPGADTIFANQSLSGDQTIVSSGGVFVLGFFNPGKSSNYYIGLWYNQVTPKTVAWVANRETPVSDRFSSELKISEGNLVLFNESKFPFWSTNAKASIVSASVRAVLLDNGNLVLTNGSNSSDPLWQSFDYPTNTWLSGNSIGYNKITKTKKILTSWTNSEDPAPGLFTFELDPSDVSYVTVWNRSRNYWTSGPWTGDGFSSVPELQRDLINYLRYASNSSEISFTMYFYNSSAISTSVMDVSGQINLMVWQPSTGWNLLWNFPRQQCQVYAFCGAYGSCSENSLPFCRCLMGFEPKSQSEWDLKDYSGGCVRQSGLNCGIFSLANGERDRVLEMPSMLMPENKQSEQARSISECEATCLIKCSCIAYIYDNNSCSIWTRDLLNLKQLEEGDSNGRTLYIRLAASDFQIPKSNKRKFVGIFVGSAAGLIAFRCVIVFLTLRRRKKKIGVGLSMVRWWHLGTEILKMHPKTFQRNWVDEALVLFGRVYCLTQLK